jgi:hypothetical protein
MKEKRKKKRKKKKKKKSSRYISVPSLSVVYLD